MNRVAFKSALVALFDVDGEALEHAVPSATARATYWIDPSLFFVQADDATAERLWRLIAQQLSSGAVAAPPDISAQLAALLKGQDTIMTALSDAVATLTADDAALAAEVDQAIGIINGIPGQVSAAVEAALQGAGADEATTLAAVQAADAATRAETAKLTSVLSPAPADTTATSAADTTAATDASPADAPAS